MLTCPHCPLDVIPTLPPHLRPHHFLCSSSALKIYLLCCPQPSLCLILSAVYHPYALAVSSRHASNSAPTPPTILMLLKRSQDKTTMPPSPLLMLLLMPPSTPLMPNPLSATYHPYAQVLDP
ncbi:hypothetical protein O181_018878 [Austropuccinia psidii MF-1]|uniref:Uncharacterized protein n=1 Tax=Austropuccinia psidii MF-1 TaxID=1389203 RepID=A0A9Q3C8M5_9BASI|nr:hypothetical protein [Austropuccinia psidii MF-1]